MMADLLATLQVRVATLLVRWVTWYSKVAHLAATCWDRASCACKESMVDWACACKESMVDWACVFACETAMAACCCAAKVWALDFLSSLRALVLTLLMEEVAVSWSVRAVASEALVNSEMAAVTDERCSG
jgi:hypothetical protein